VVRAQEQVIRALEQAQEQVLELAQEQVKVLGLAAALVRQEQEQEPLQELSQGPLVDL
jgi:hypothetical protein